MLLDDFTFGYGTNFDDDHFSPRSVSAFFARSGDDSLTGFNGSRHTVLAGGSGNDTYSLRLPDYLNPARENENGNGFVLIFDHDGASDTFVETSINYSNNDISGYGIKHITDGAREYLAIVAPYNYGGVIFELPGTSGVPTIENFVVGAILAEVLEGSHTVGSTLSLAELLKFSGVDGTLDNPHFLGTTTAAEFFNQPAGQLSQLYAEIKTEALLAEAFFTVNVPTNYGDVLTGSDNADLIAGLGGGDRVHAGAGGDLVYGGDGSDHVFGEAGDDLVYGGDGRDDLSGGAGDDEIHGGSGEDFITGGVGDDRLYGEDSFDLLLGGEGNDILHGGSGRGDFVRRHIKWVKPQPELRESFAHLV